MNSASIKLMHQTDSDTAKGAQPYFFEYENVVPPEPRVGNRIWHLFAGATVALGLFYLHWRWTDSLNSDAMVFSVLVASAESALFIGSILFFYDIWDECDTELRPLPKRRSDLGLNGEGPIVVDVFVTTFDEDLALVKPSILDAKSLLVPDSCALEVHLLDDGDRKEFREFADLIGVHYHSRQFNTGFKAGNIHNALMHSRGDFIIICDADTRLFPTFLKSTLSYFRDTKVAWVQTPHWFYDIRPGTKWGDLLNQKFGFSPLWAEKVLRYITGTERTGADPFCSDPQIFFDVIQRRRNRHNASFCCGAGSIHRREALMNNALSRQGVSERRTAACFSVPRANRNLAFSRLEPVGYHVSEDLLTSIYLHCGGWKSVYHPHIEAKMLSPQSLPAWSAQKRKYSQGTFDIAISLGWMMPNRSLPRAIQLHYFATFWSYFSVLWMPVLLVAPFYSLATGRSPVDSYTTEFAMKLIPVLIIHEITVFMALKGHNNQRSRLQTIISIPIFMKSLKNILTNDSLSFDPTPKTVERSTKRFINYYLLYFTLCLATFVVAISNFYLKNSDHNISMIIINSFWIAWNSLFIIEIFRIEK